MHLNELARSAHNTAVQKGWYNPPRTFPETLMMIVSECVEALEEYRISGNQDHIISHNCAIELADILIRVLDTMAYYNIDAEAVITEKMTYNATRPYRHGGKLL